MAGTISTIPILYTLAIILLFIGTTGYCYGVDRFTEPYAKELFN